MFLSCICLLAMHTLICVTFSLPPGVRGWLRLLLVALPGLFCLPFCLNLTLNLPATCMQSVLCKGNTIRHAVIQGYGICMYASAFFLNGLNFNLLEDVEHNTKQIP